MSTKSKASSKNKKAVAKKAPAKKANDKKKVAKPAAKSKPAKKTTVKAKPAPKKAAPKKPVKKVVATKKVVKAKPAPKKVAAKAKPVAKKAVAKKPVKKVAVKKAPVKKAAVKPVVKTVKKAVVKAKPAPKKVEVKAVKVVKASKPTPAAKKVVKEVVKVEAPVKEKKVKVAPAPVKKQIVAPTTFRVEETASSKTVKEPNGKFEMEFVVRASEDMVFEFVSTESGLSEWFCDDVNIRNGIFTFTWDGQTQQAKLVKEVPPMYIRYQWLDKNDGSYFEFKIQKDELTNDISLIVTDFADNKADEESARLLWHSQVDKLLHVLGSFF